MARYSNVFIEAGESYLKQSYRNRCVFLGANGPETLQVPVRHNATSIREIEIDYSKPWIHVHERALMSAYKMSPFFDHYSPELFAILESKPRYLFDLNMQITEFLVRKLYLDVKVAPTEGEFVRAYDPADAVDLRYLISPKKPATSACEPYFQVFTPTLEKFVENLSIVDLLFNEGPSAEVFLRSARSL